MLSRQQFDRLIDARNETQIISTLADTPYGQARAEDADSMIDFSAREEEAFFSRYLEEEKVGEFFQAPVLTSNLKWSLRKHYGARIDDALFISERSPAPDEFEKMLAGEDSSVPEWLRNIAGEVVAANYGSVDPSSIDVICDRGLIEYQNEKSDGYSFLRAVLALRVDLTNLLSMLRLKVSGKTWEDFENFFLSSGTIKNERFKTWWDAGIEAWPNQVPSSEPYANLEEGLREASGSFLLIERQIKEREIELMLTTRRLTFGYEPLVGYALIKREERGNIGRIITGQRYGLDAETIRKSIAWFN